MLRSDSQNVTSRAPQHPVLTEPVQVHQHLVAGVQDLAAGVAGRGTGEVDAQGLGVVVDADERPAGARRLPVVEADDQREDDRAGEEEQEPEQVR